MDKLTEKIAYKIKEYPTIFPTRSHVLQHMYIVIGNGYDWINGKLEKDPSLAKDDSRTSDKEAVEKIRKKYEDRRSSLGKLPDVMISRKYFLREAINLKRYRYCIFNSFELAKGQVPDWIRFEPSNEIDPDRKWDWCRNEGQYKKMGWYPITGEMSNILNVPQDVDPVYLAGAVEILLKKIDHPEWWSELQNDGYNENQIKDLIESLIQINPECKSYVKRY